MQKKEVRVQYMLPHQLHEARGLLPIIFLPLGPLEWHGPHMPLGVDPLNAETVALEVARRIGGVVLPTLYMGTERERPPEMLESLGFGKDEYVVGMDFPQTKGLYNSFYSPEEIFAATLRVQIEKCIVHEYRFTYIVNGHGAVNHNEVIARLCTEFSNERNNVKVSYSTAFPNRHIEAGLLAHGGMEETSLMMHCCRGLVDLGKLPPAGERLKYTDYGVVDGGGFIGSPGAGHAVPEELDPRTKSNPAMGRDIHEETVRDMVGRVREAFELGQ